MATNWDGKIELERVNEMHNLCSTSKKERCNRFGDLPDDEAKPAKLAMPMEDSATRTK